MCVCFFVLTKGTWDPAIAKNLIVGGVIPQKTQPMPQAQCSSRILTMFHTKVNSCPPLGKIITETDRQIHGKPRARRARVMTGVGLSWLLAYGVGGWSQKVSDASAWSDHKRIYWSCRMKYLGVQLGLMDISMGKIPYPIIIGTAPPQ